MAGTSHHSAGVSGTKLDYPWEGTGWPLHIFKEKDDISERPHYFCARKDCRDNRRILKEPWLLTCGHRMCKECFNIAKNRVHTEQYCDLCAVESHDEDARTVGRVLEAQLGGRKHYQVGGQMDAIPVSQEEHMEWDAVPFEERQAQHQRQNGGSESTSTALPKIHFEQCRRDAVANKEIAKLVVNCPYDCQCPDEIVVKTLEAHMMVCANRQVPCDKCTEQVMFKKLDEHKKEYCEFRPVQCPNGCGIRGLQHKDLPRHRNECVKKLPVCRICKSTYDMPYDEHAINCKVAECPFPTCRVAVNGSIVDHLADEKFLSKHLYALLAVAADSKDTPTSTQGMSQEQIKTLQDRLLQLEYRTERSVATLEQKLQDISGQAATGLFENAEQAKTNRETLDELETVFKIISNDVHLLTSYNQAFRDLQDKVHKQEGEIVEKVTKLENMSQVRVAQIEDQKLLLNNLQRTSFQGRLIWRIDRVSARRDESHVKHSFYSHPFFTEVYGYKMCARIYFNGDGNGKNTHISLFFVVMKGEFDALLPWPFQQKVTMKLRNLLKTKPDIIEKFRPEPSSTSFARPKNEMNIASGCPQFAEQSLVFTPANGYVVDDTMFVEIIVDTSYVPLHGLNASTSESSRSSSSGAFNK